MISGYPPPGSQISVRSTDELRIGDKIYMSFPFGSRGSLVFGTEETFTVDRVGPEGVFFVDESGARPTKIPLPMKGTYDQLVGKLRELTSINKLEVWRVPAKDMPPPGVKALEGYKRFHGSANSLVPGMKASFTMPDGTFIVGTIVAVEPVAKEEWPLTGTVIYRMTMDLPPKGRDVGSTGYVNEKAIATGRYTAWEPLVPIAAQAGAEFPWVAIVIGIGVVGAALAFVFLRKSE